MKSGEELDEILAEIGREHRKIGAPEWLEPMLFAAAKKKNRSVERTSTRLAWPLAAAAILLAVVATAGIIWETRGSHPTQAQRPLSAPVPRLNPESTPVSTRDAVDGSLQARSGPIRRVGRSGARNTSAKQAEWNSLDEFVALPASEGLPPAAELSVVRIELRGSELQQYGLQAPADGAAQTMLAEFVVGEDGLPRAIRIVR